MRQPAVFLAALFAATSLGVALARTPADKIFADSHNAVTRLPEPPFIPSTLQDNGHTDQSQQQEKLRVLVRSSDGYAIVVPLKNPNGSDVTHPSPLLIKGPRYGDLSYIVGLGDFPLDDFGMRLGGIRRQSMFDAPGTPDLEPSGLRSIMTVRAYNPAYQVDDFGDMTLDGMNVYHFGLTPLRDFGHHPLREIWIDKGSLLPVRYVAAIPVTYANDTDSLPITRRRSIRI